MGFDFHRADGSFSITVSGWSNILQLALAYGWQPVGTVMAGNDSWNGGYDTNDRQQVTDVDAKGLAAALEKALPDLPNHDALEHKLLVFVKLPDGGVETRCSTDPPFPGEMIICHGVPMDAQTTPWEWLSGEGKERLREFIEFCRGGGFRID